MSTCQKIACHQKPAGFKLPRVVVGSVFFAGDELFRVEELTVGSRPDFVDHVRLQIDEDGARNVLTGARLGEESVERIVATPDRLVRGHLWRKNGRKMWWWRRKG